ncbi:metallophosphoesterase [Nordella sp. HKS 07]|uniref:metallophosphoesterase n=1 Tax=Nordella sp. HKS 07 TaxID=2712222 RepID=UPI0013E18CE8|nr:metallophosphoesterase [Nordella sp. HKS 07]QIG52694.1 metallophosphoesterase [Nordella sp. HKS 07]
MMNRRTFFKWLGGLALSGAAMTGYAFGIEPGFLLRVQQYKLTPPGWPADFKLRIAALADIHAGNPYMSLARVERIVAATNALNPDLILMLGDYAAGHRLVTSGVPIKDTASVCAGLAAPLGRHAILGNHDWWDDRAAQKRRAGPSLYGETLKAAGIPVYENDGVRLEHNGRAFWLLGLADQIAFIAGRNRFIGLDDLDGTLAKVTDDAPVILMIHEPDGFTKVPKRVSLTLAGHTHGGQVRLLGYSPVVPSAYGNRFAYGHVVEDDRHLIVSGGLGCSILPVRFGMPPEIVLIELGA